MMQKPMRDELNCIVDDARLRELAVNSLGSHAEPMPLWARELAQAILDTREMMRAAVGRMESELTTLSFSRPLANVGRAPVVRCPGVKLEPKKTIVCQQCGETVAIFHSKQGKAYWCDIVTSNEGEMTGKNWFHKCGGYAG
jgi:hypothetical protein